MEQISKKEGLGVGGVVGYLDNNATANGCYYRSINNDIKGVGQANGTITNQETMQMTGENMKKQDFVDLLNQDQEDKPWILDTNNINNGYPILSWQEE